MKTIIGFLIIGFCFGCGENRNEVMTRLINQRVAIDRKIAAARQGDNSMKNMVLVLRLKDSLNAINFSIDSLSKMK